MYFLLVHVHVYTSHRKRKVGKTVGQAAVGMDSVLGQLKGPGSAAVGMESVLGQLKGPGPAAVGLESVLGQLKGSGCRKRLKTTVKRSY